MAVSPQPYSAASRDLGIGLGNGLGADLTDKVQMALKERQKMKKMTGDQTQSPMNPQGLSSAAQSLGLAPNIAR